MARLRRSFRSWRVALRARRGQCLDPRQPRRLGRVLLLARRRQRLNRGQMNARREKAEKAKRRGRRLSACPGNPCGGRVRRKSASSPRRLLTQLFKSKLELSLL